MTPAHQSTTALKQVSHCFTAHHHNTSSQHTITAHHHSTPYCVVNSDNTGALKLTSILTCSTLSHRNVDTWRHCIRCVFQSSHSAAYSVGYIASKAACLAVITFVCLPTCLHVCLSVRPSVRPSVHLSVCLLGASTTRQLGRCVYRSVQHVRHMSGRSAHHSQHSAHHHSADHHCCPGDHLHQAGVHLHSLCSRPAALHRG